MSEKNADMGPSNRTNDCEKGDLGRASDIH